MESKENQLTFLPYLLALLLLAAALVLDGALARVIETSTVSFNFWPRVIVLMDAKLVFGLLAALFIWVLARVGLSTAGAWVFIALGLLIGALPFVYVAQWFQFSYFLYALLGEYLLSGGVLLLAAGVIALVAKAVQKSLPVPTA